MIEQIAVVTCDKCKAVSTQDLSLMTLAEFKKELRKEGWFIAANACRPGLDDHCPECEKAVRR